MALRRASHGLLRVVAFAVLLYPISSGSQPRSQNDAVYALQQLTTLQRGKLWLPAFPAGSIVVHDTVDYQGNILFAFEMKLSDAPILIGKSSYAMAAVTQSTPYMLRGTVTNGSITGFIAALNTSKTPMLRIPPKRFNVTIASTRGRLTPLYGGELLVNDRSLTLTNTSEIVITPSSARGVLEFVGSKITLRNVALNLGGGVTDARPTLRSDANARFSIDLGSNLVKLVGGELSADTRTALADAADGWDLAGARFGGVSQASVGTITIRSTNRVVGQMTSTRFNASSLDHAAPHLHATPSATVTVRQLSSPVKYSTEVLALDEPELKDARIDASKIEYFGENAEPNVSGAGLIDLSTLSAEWINGSTTFRSPRVPILSGALSRADVSELFATFRGPKAKLRIDGALSFAQVGIGALSLSDLPDRVAKFIVGGGPGIDFEVDAKRGMAALGLPEKDAQRLFVGRIAAFAAKGDLDPTRAAPIRISPGTLRGALKQFRAASASLFGGTPSFLNDEVLLSAAGEIASGVRARGAITLNTGKLTIPGAHLKPSGSSGTFVLSPIISEGGAELAIDLAEPAVRLTRGVLSLAPIEITQEAPFDVTVANVMVSAPSLKIGSLTIAAVGDELTLDLVDTMIGIGTFNHSQPPRLSGKIAQPVTIRTVHCKLVPSAQQIDFVDAEASGFVLAARDLQFVSPDGLVLDISTADVRFARISTTEATGSLGFGRGSVVLQSAAEGRAAINSATLIFSGPKEKLNGSGSIDLDGIRLVHQSSEPLLPDKCPGSPFPLRLSGSVSATSVAIALHDGVPTIQANLGTIDAGLASQSDRYACEYDQKVVTIPEIRLNYGYPCGFFDWCEGSIVLVGEQSVQVHWVAEVFQLKADVRVEGAQIRSRGGSGLTVCGAKLTRVGNPEIRASYHPNVPSSGNPILDLPRDILRGTAALLETSLLQTVGSAGSLFVNMSGGIPLVADCPTESVALANSTNDNDRREP
jgi:hypothetical protein